METSYRAFLFQTLYMLINKPIEEYDILFGKISKLYDEYLVSDISQDYSKSEYDAINYFLTQNKETKNA